MSEEDVIRVDHKSTKKNKKKKQDYKINPIEPADDTAHDVEDTNHLSSPAAKKKPEIDQATQDVKVDQARKCYVEAGLCCALIILAGIFIYLYEFTDVIRVRPEKEIYV